MDWKRAVKWRSCGLIGGPSSSGRFSAFHLGKPPSSTATSSWPKTLNIHQTRAAENRPDAVVADDFLAIANAHLADVAGKFFRPGQHVGQGAFGIGNQVDVEELGAGNAGCEELRLGIALGGGQVPRAIDDGNIGRGEMLGEPVRLKRVPAS